ncbi:MAG: Rpn family recombination-promoting nuclease/putative transposase [Leptospiraceae bacterium]|nr:Rpn family recombination-promoting nuclease/putative transposase [Leptospiraceae bacterium]
MIILFFVRCGRDCTLASDISLDTLEIAKDSFIDPNYQDIQSDMLFKVSIAGKESYIYLLLEHKSYPDRMTAFQLLKYIVGIWTLHLNQLEKGEADTLPIILPLSRINGKAYRAGVYRNGFTLFALRSKGNRT